MSPRLRHLDALALTDSQSALYRSIAHGTRAQGPQAFPLTDDQGRLRGPFNAFLLSPALGNALQQVGAAIRYESQLTPRVRELAILVVAARWDSAFERSAHDSVGRMVGLVEAELEALARGEIPVLADPAEAVAVDCVVAMLDGDVSDNLYDSAVAQLGEVTLFELSTLVGYYATLALQLRLFRVDPYDAAD